MVDEAPTPELDLVRKEVRKVLDRCAAWRELSDDDRKAFARNMVHVGSFLSNDPGWLDAVTPVAAPQVAESLASPIDDLKKRLAQKPGQVGQEFEAGAVKQGVEEFGNLVRKVDFPAFVSGLIQGVFQAIVDASIQQMQAYGELLAATAKTVDQFASDHITDDQAREHVASRHPSVVKIVRVEGGASSLAPASDDADTSALQGLTRTKERVDLSDEESERKFVTGAKLEMARQRQKLMALMVLLGINRIVVTNGKINAKVIFDVEASDTANRSARASLVDTQSSATDANMSFGLPWSGGGVSTKQRHKTTVQSSIDDTSESKAKMKAQLTGEVNVNFRSETLPPERMIDALQFDQLNYLATGSAPAPAPAAGGAR